MIHRKISQYFAVQFDTRFGCFADELRIREAMLADTGVDTLNPDGTVVAFFEFTTYVGVCETFFDLVFGDGPHILAATPKAFSELEDLLPSGPGSDGVY